MASGFVRNLNAWRALTLALMGLAISGGAAAIDGRADSSGRYVAGERGSSFLESRDRAFAQGHPESGLGVLTDGFNPIADSRVRSWRKKLDLPASFVRHAKVRSYRRQEAAPRESWRQPHLREVAVRGQLELVSQVRSTRPERHSRVSVDLSTLIGGSSSDDGIAVVQAHDGSIVIAGNTASDDFPDVDPNSVLGGVRDGYVMKVDPRSGAAAWATLIGGAGMF